MQAQPKPPASSIAPKPPLRISGYAPAYVDCVRALLFDL